MIIFIGLFSAVAMPMLIFMEGNVALLYAAFAGFGIGGLIGTNSLVWPAYFGRSHLGAIVGVSRPFETAVMASGPLLMAQSFDRTADTLLALAMGVSCDVLGRCCWRGLRGSERRPGGGSVARAAAERG